MERQELADRFGVWLGEDVGYHSLIYQVNRCGAISVSSVPQGTGYWDGPQVCRVCFIPCILGWEYIQVSTGWSQRLVRCVVDYHNGDNINILILYIPSKGYSNMHIFCIRPLSPEHSCVEIVSMSSFWGEDSIKNHQGSPHCGGCIRSVVG